MATIIRKSEMWDIDIDRYINRVVPRSPLHHLPTPISRFLGYRKEPKEDVGNVMGAFWSLLGAFCGLAVVAAVFNNLESIQVHHPPALIASFVRTFSCLTIPHVPSSCLTKLRNFRIAIRILQPHVLGLQIKVWTLCCMHWGNTVYGTMSKLLHYCPLSMS